ncbi:MAG: hypothetical protein AAGE52_30390 [Myxococcota bacterium]
MRPWPATILAIDPGETSGAALFVGGRLQGVWRVSGADPAKQVVAVAQETERETELPLVVVLETWAGNIPGGTVTASGLGSAAGMWRAVLELAKHPKRRTLKVNPMTWYARLIGGRKTRGKDKVVSAMLLRFPELKRSKGIDHNVAEAVAIGVWASRAGEVGKVLPKKTLKAHAFPTQFDLSGAKEVGS